MKRISFILLLTILASSAICAKVTRNWNSSSPDNLLTLIVDSIDFTPDYTRVYGKLAGRPHTSGRIDASAITVKGKVMEGTDIDGVDFKRYFQWEDDGFIPVELDFPAMKPFGKGFITLDTPRGHSLTTVSDGSNNKRTK